MNSIQIQWIHEFNSNSMNLKQWKRKNTYFGWDWKRLTQDAETNVQCKDKQLINAKLSQFDKAELLWQAHTEQKVWIHYSSRDWWRNKGRWSITASNQNIHNWERIKNAKKGRTEWCKGSKKASGAIWLRLSAHYGIERREKGKDSSPDIRGLFFFNFRWAIKKRQIDIT